MLLTCRRATLRDQKQIPFGNDRKKSNCECGVPHIRKSGRGACNVLGCCFGRLGGSGDAIHHFKPQFVVERIGLDAQLITVADLTIQESP